MVSPYMPVPKLDRIPAMYAGGRCVLSAVNVADTLLKIPAEVFDAIDPAPLGLTIEVRPAAGSVSGGTDNHRPQARIEWGSPKGGGLAAFDLINGVTLNLEACSSLQIGCSLNGYSIDDSFSPGAVALVTAPVLEVVCSVGRGGAGKPKTNTFTDILRAIGAGALVLVPVPRYAVQVEVRHNGNPFAAIPPDIQVGFLQSAAIGTPARILSGLRDTPLSVPSGTQALGLTNLSAGALQTQLVYRLDI